MIYVLKARCEDGTIYAYAMDPDSCAWCDLLATADRFYTPEAAARAAEGLNSVAGEWRAWRSAVSVLAVSEERMEDAEKLRAELQKEAELEDELYGRYLHEDYGDLLD